MTICKDNGRVNIHCDCTPCCKCEEEEQDQARRDERLLAHKKAKAARTLVWVIRHQRCHPDIAKMIRDLHGVS